VKTNTAAESLRSATMKSAWLLSFTMRVTLTVSSTRTIKMRTVA
jgi:hypothetical protein